MLRTAYSLASIVLACWITASGSSAQQTLRIAMTTADVPTTTGAPNQGLEGFRFAGFPAFEPLVRWDLRVTETVPPVVPWLARSFESDPADRKRWVFTLREGVKFHDGSELTADAVVWNFERFFNESAPHYEKNAAALARVWLSVVDKWEKLDKYRVAVFTKEPTSYFPEVMTAFSSQFRRLRGRRQGLAKVLRRAFRHRTVPHHAGHADVDRDVQESGLLEQGARRQARPHRSASDAQATTRLAALRSGQVDLIEVPPPDAISGLKSAGFDVVTSKFPHISAVLAQDHGRLTFKDARVRQAFNYAIDRDAVLALLNGAGEPAFGFWKRGDPRFGNPKND